jgi:hypothetical protein
MLGHAQPRDRPPELLTGERAATDALRAVTAATPVYPADRFDGRGVVVCAGGSRLLACAWVTIGLLRRTLGCTLPIEVWHLGREELGPVEAALFSELGVHTVDALEVRTRHPARILGGWELKAHALANCGFSEVLLLDADNAPLRDPSFLFESDRYRSTGAVFWPDLVQIGRDNPVWELCEVPFRAEPAWESGQVVLDKARCWHALQLALCMNEHSEVFYRHLLGDKDTYHLAWRMLEQPCAMPRRPVRTPWGLLQHDFEGQPLFQHRTRAKWVLRGDNVLDPGFRFEDECLALLHDLETRWNGRIESLPERTPADLATEAELTRVRLFQLTREAHDSATLELLSSNRVGDGRSQAMLRWYVLDGELVLEGLIGRTCVLRRERDGAWRGQWEEPGKYRVELRPLGPSSAQPVESVVAAVIAGVSNGTVQADDGVTTLVTLGRIAALTEVLARERTRWDDGSAAADAIDRARWRLGRRNPSLRALEGSHRREYGPG